METKKKIMLIWRGLCLCVIIFVVLFEIVLPLLGFPVFKPPRPVHPNDPNFKYTEKMIERSQDRATSKKIAELFPDDGLWVTGLNPSKEDIAKALDDVGVKYEVNDYGSISVADGADFRVDSFMVDASIKQTSSGLKVGDNVKTMHEIYDQIDVPLIRDYPEKNYSAYLYETALIGERYVYIKVRVVGNDTSGKVMDISILSSKFLKSDMADSIL